MSNVIISGLDQVTTEWLTQVLSDSGALTRGSVAGYEIDEGSGNWSDNARLQIEYEAGSLGDLPARLFLKMVETDLDDEFFGGSEVTYYTRDYVGVKAAPLLRCYNAAYSEADHRYHLLLDDVSETHIEAAQKEPTLEYGLALAEGLAVLHAHWWGGERLAEAEAPIHNEPHIRRFVDIAEPGVDHILAQFSSELAPHWPNLLRTLYADHPTAIISRARETNGFTLIHGDVGQNNILVPRDGVRPIYIIDRQPFDWSLTTWLGIYDLAYAIVLDWEIKTRRRLEMAVLRRYHEQLQASGVTGYPWERLLEDYRLAVPMGVYIATEYCRGGVNQRWVPIWLPYLQRSLTACDDLECSQLW